jgi:PAS domain S-box-containing protein
MQPGDIGPPRFGEGHPSPDAKDLRKALDEHAIVAITTPRGIITHVNDKFCAISKYAREELIGKDHRIINSGHHNADFFRELWGTISGGGVWKGEICNRAKDGSLYWVATTIVPFLGVDGKVEQYIAIRADITERVLAEQSKAELLDELKEINEELNQFAYVVSHDLKAPLRAICSLADWLVADHGEKLGDEGRTQLGLIQGRVKRLDILIDGILRYSRIGRDHDRVTVIDTHELIREVCEMISPPATIVVVIQKSLPVVSGERTRLTQVFENLVSNAVKYMGKPAGTITIGGAETPEHWEFFVSDTGVGIEARHFERIFQIFQTLASRDETESTGIGLAVVKKNIEVMGGRAWVESEVGVGSTFRFRIPKLHGAPRTGLTPDSHEKHGTHTAG